MDSINMETEMECTIDDLTGLSASPSCSDVGDIFGYPQVTPRVGHEYQAEIPPLVVENDMKGQTGACVATEVSQSFLLGLPIPIMWTNDEVENINGTVEFENSKESHISSSNEHATVKVEPLDAVLDDEKEIEQLPNRESTVGVDKMDIDSLESKTKLNQAEKCSCPLPGSLGESLTDIERDGFLLGLYIFGKNLMLVKRFVKDKQMGDVLSFYYGKFYKSAEYRRWSECRKMRSRRRIHGQKIFTGWRLQELLSRISSCVTEENQKLLIEVSRKFEDGKVSFEDYVFALKDMVGISMFIEVVGIGRGKKDLTGNTMEPAKPNPVFLARPEIPTGKAWSSLTLGDIIKFLTGDFRLSKARSNDLFWEAVWPRLLARGWHSEQPKDHGISSLKHSLVFLIPGVKKFSRRRLVKGNQYFDSVSDVLNKVASDPGLLELETEAANGGEHKEDQTWDDAPMEQDSKQRNHCYLQPRNSSSSQNLMKFTVIDTSLVSGKGRPKVRELRSLPVGVAISTPSSLSSESEKGTSEDEAEETNGSKPAEDRGTCADSSDCVTSILSNGLIYVPDTTMETHDSQSTSLPNEKQPVEITNHQVNRKVKSGQANHRPSVRKCQNFTACCNGESSRSTELISAVSKLNEGDSGCRSNSNSPDVCEDMLYLVGNGRSQNLPSASSLAKGSPDRSNGAIITKNRHHRQHSPEKHQRRTLIDLNLPQVSGTDEPFIMQNHDDSSGEKSSSLQGIVSELKPLKLPEGGASTTEQDSTMNSRRQSTRNRPLTTKALEALQWGFFHTNTNKKRKDAEAPENSARPSRRPRRRAKVADITSVNGISSNTSDSKEEENSNGVIGSNSFLDVNSHI